MELLESLNLVSTNSLLISASVILCIVYLYKTTFSYWSNRGVSGITFIQSLTNSLRLFLRIDSFQSSFVNLYNLLEGHKYGGMYQFTTPALVLRDPDLIQNFLVKGFSQFHDRSTPQDENLDPLSGNLFILTGDRWRNVRQKVSPAFSSAKLKIMFLNLKECAQELDDYLQRLTADTGYVDVEAKKLTSDYSLDVIGACSMGIKCSSIGTGETDFKRITRDVFRFDLRRTVHALLEVISPKLPPLIGWKAVRMEVEEFFMNACREAAALKEHKSNERKDFLSILMNVRKSEESMRQKSESLDDKDDLLFSDNIIAAMISSFFSAGFEPVAATMTMCLYELAQHPEAQEKLYAEIQSVEEEIGEEITYESLKKFQYATQVIEETLRLYPVAPVLGRQCTERFVIPESRVVIDKGVKLFLPLYGLQRDAQYFSDPDEFDPERFSEENKDKILPGTYLPFGDGPRACVAYRFAMMDMKYMLVRLLSKYTVHTTAETQRKIVFDPKSFTLIPLGDLILRFERRT